MTVEVSIFKIEIKFQPPKLETCKPIIVGFWRKKIVHHKPNCKVEVKPV